MKINGEPFTLDWWLVLYGIAIASQVEAHRHGKNNDRAAEITLWIHDRIVTKYDNNETITCTHNG